MSSPCDEAEIIVVDVEQIDDVNENQNNISSSSIEENNDLLTTPLLLPTTQVQEEEEVRISFVRDRRGPCSWLFNFLWLLLGGWHLFLSWFFVGMLLCLSIIGIPFGLQVLKIACFLLFPFGKCIVAVPYQGSQCMGCNCCCNCVWVILVGWILALQFIGTGILLCLSIVGIPFGWQCFKLAYIAVCPFGLDVSSEIVETVTVTTTTIRDAVIDQPPAVPTATVVGGSGGGK